jgi:hypothetical protein
VLRWSSSQALVDRVVEFLFFAIVVAGAVHVNVAEAILTLQVNTQCLKPALKHLRIKLP